jgi:uncharacterized membrane protein YccC
MKNIFKINSPVIRNAVRVSTAAAIAIAFDRYIKSPYAYWTLMTTIIIMQANLGASINKAKQRVIGTILGVLVGVMLGVVFQNQAYFFAIIIPLLILLFIYAMPFSYTIAIFFGSMLVIILLAYQDPNPWIFVFKRIIDTLIGAGIGLGVCMFLWPTWAKEDFSDSLTNGMKSCHTFFTKIMRGLSGGNINDQEIIASVIETEKFLKESQQRFNDFTHEPNAIQFCQGAAKAIIYSQERIHNILLSLNIIQKDTNIEQIDNNLKKQLAAFLATSSNLVEHIIQSIEQHKKLPKFLDPYDSLKQINNAIKNSPHKDEAKFALLYRNLFTYIAELRHIIEAIKQIRG